MNFYDYRRVSRWKPRGLICFSRYSMLELGCRRVNFVIIDSRLSRLPSRIAKREASQTLAERPAIVRQL